MNTLLPDAPADTPLDDGLAEELAKDPLGPASIGAFFPGGPPRLPLLDEFEPLGDPKTGLLLHLRHIPTDATLQLARDRFGPDCDALLASWRAAWDRLPGGPDAIAARAGYTTTPDEDVSPLLLAQVVRRVRERSAGTLEALSLVALAARQHESCVLRETELHILEDAVVMTELLAAKVPFSVLASLTSGKGFLLDFRGRRPRIRTTRAARIRQLRDTFGRCNADRALPSFLRHAGRGITEAGGMSHLFMVLLDMARLGHRKAFVKDSIFKGGTWVVDLDGVRSFADAVAATTRAMGPNCVALMSRIPVLATQRRFFSVQEFTPFEYEHRFFVVDGRIVASTPSDRTLSMLDAHHGRGRLDPRVAKLARPARDAGYYDRGTTNSVEDRRMVAGMARKVRALLTDIGRHDVVARAFLPRAFVVDVGSGPAGLGIIEINPFRNAGLYGVDYRRVARALSRSDNFDPGHGGVAFTDALKMSSTASMRWIIESFSETIWAAAGNAAPSPEKDIEAPKP